MDEDFFDGTVTLAEQDRLKKQREILMREFLTRALEHEGGQAFLFSILDASAVMGLSMFSTCEKLQAWHEGKRHIGAMVFKQLKDHVPDLFFDKLKQRLKGEA